MPDRGSTSSPRAEFATPRSPRAESPLSAHHERNRHSTLTTSGNHHSPLTTSGFATPRSPRAEITTPRSPRADSPLPAHHERKSPLSAHHERNRHSTLTLSLSKGDPFDCGLLTQDTRPQRSIGRLANKPGDFRSLLDVPVVCLGIKNQIVEFLKPLAEVGLSFGTSH